MPSGWIATRRTGLPGLRPFVAAIVGIAALVSACGAPAGTGSPLPSVGGASPSASSIPSASVGTGSLTDEEIRTLTGGSWIPIPADAPAPVITAAAAEAIVRAKYPGQRTTIGVVRISMGLPSGTRTGWMVALSPADGESCTSHAGLLPRALEGGVVDDQGGGDPFWIFTCSP